MCKTELPVWKELHKKLGNRVEFIGVNVGINERIESVRQYVKSHEINFLNVFDKDKKIINAFGVMGTPTHIVIDRKGIIRYKGVEPPKDIEEHIQDLS